MFKELNPKGERSHISSVVMERYSPSCTSHIGHHVNEVIVGDFPLHHSPSSGPDWTIWTPGGWGGRPKNNPKFRHTAWRTLKFLWVTATVWDVKDGTERPRQIREIKSANECCWPSPGRKWKSPWVSCEHRFPQGRSRLWGWQNTII